MVSTRLPAVALIAFSFGCASAGGIGDSGGDGTLGGALVTVTELATLDAFEAYVAFSPDGRALAVVGQGSPSTEASLHYALEISGVPDKDGLTFCRFVGIEPKRVFLLTGSVLPLTLSRPVNGFLILTSLGGLRDPSL
jgi:hypothetical protein